MSSGESRGSILPCRTVGPSPRCQWLLSLTVVALAALSLTGTRSGAEPVQPTVLASPATPGVVGGADSGVVGVVGVGCESVLRRYARDEPGYLAGMQAHPICEHRGTSVLYYDFLDQIGVR